MTCVRIESGFLCGPDAWLSLEPYGSRVWMSYHNYLGPTFYLGPAAKDCIKTPSNKTWAAFAKWHEERKAGK